MCKIKSKFKYRTGSRSRVRICHQKPDWTPGGSLGGPKDTQHIILFSNIADNINDPKY